VKAGQWPPPDICRHRKEPSDGVVTSRDKKQTVRLLEGHFVGIVTHSPTFTKTWGQSKIFYEKSRSFCMLQIYTATKIHRTQPSSELLDAMFSQS
jgi:hypothetical protein